MGIEGLAERLAEGVVVGDPGVVASYSRDQTFVVPGEALGVVLARSTEDVAVTLAWADENRVPVVPRGAGTGLAGGATATDGSVVLSLARMNAIRELNTADQYAVVEPGVINADLDRAARAHGLMYAPDPSSHEISTLGGNLATNAGGLRCVKYGVTRESVLGLEVVLAGGKVINTGGRTVKGVTGYDLTGLFVGSEGTLGVITGATLRLRPAPSAEPVTVAGTFPSMVAAGEAVAAVVAAGIEPSLLELVDRATLLAIDDWKNIGVEDDTAAMLIGQVDVAEPREPAARMAALFEAAGATAVAVSEDRAESDELLGIRRMAYHASERLGHCLVEDVCVPRSKVPEMIARIEKAASGHDVTVLTVAHAGDGNLHPLFVFDRGESEVPAPVWAAADEIFQGALDLGGTLTGEHGVGVLKRRWLGLELGDDRLAVQHAIKAALDPNGILNPGKAI
ncbi:FAD-binding oxidoreductase [Bailinhaonella thermotolerans]|uniref:FAD-binding protein n=1 Tax=Bailinhaonella thermotolerans TaxID=1070861 RepID=A0A3A4B8E6_9ACTN|nr:FAD-linked oxidase C-terminal domain-containing protein [Bailinhaonella thermotolerans]RJL34501.1 FAD-binding protein [Bailinhaonella thermotolerans]